MSKFNHAAINLPPIVVRATKRTSVWSKVNRFYDENEATIGAYALVFAIVVATAVPAAGFIWKVVLGN